jgi:hypothetical protein
VEKVERLPNANVSPCVRDQSERGIPLKVAEFEPLGLFKGERTFTVEPDLNGTAEFSMREQYKALMAPPIGRSIPDLQPAFDEFARDLKRAAEEK